MAKNYNLKELIPKTLKKMGPSGKNEIREFIIKNNEEINNISDKALNENILKLLKDGKIEIIDYDFSKHKSIRMQHVKSESLIFDIVRNSPMEIKALLNQLESNDPIIVKQANDNLKKIFRMKFREEELDEQKVYKNRLKDIQTNYPHIILEKINEEIKETKEINDKKILKKCSEIVKRYYTPKEVKLERLIALKKVISKVSHDQKIWYISGLGSTVRFQSMTIGKDIIIDSDNSMTPEKFMKEIGKKPLFLETKKVDMFYEFTISSLIFNLNSNEKENLKKELIFILSDLSYDLIKSLKFFLRQLYNKIDYKWENFDYSDEVDDLFKEVIFY